MSPAAVTPPARFLRLLDAAPLRWKIASIGAVGALGMVVLTGCVGRLAAVQVPPVTGEAVVSNRLIRAACSPAQSRAWLS